MGEENRFIYDESAIFTLRPAGISNRHFLLPNRVVTQGTSISHIYISYCN
jgi:hypothetical protein